MPRRRPFFRVDVSVVFKRRTAWLFTALVLCLFSGCKAGGNAERLEILNAISASAACEYLPTNDPVGEGWYDPSVDDAKGYILGLSLRNNMQIYTQDPLPLGEIITVNGTAHDVQVVGAEGCWYVANGNNLPPNAYDSGSHLIDCSKIPGQSASLGTSGYVGEGGTLGTVTLRVLTLQHLRTLFGAAFDPANLPPRGAHISPNPADNPSLAGISQTTSTVLGYDFGPPDPTDLATRSAAWGNFPASYQAQVIVQLRLRVQLQDNTTFVTNYISYPIEICPRCLQGMCGRLTQKTCAKGPCGDGTPCLASGTCVNTALTCSPLTMFSGNVPDFLTGTCLPAQNYAVVQKPSCVPTGCDVTQ